MTVVSDPVADEGAGVAASLGYRPFDADNHYYEALDAFSRHLDPALATRVFQWAQIDGRSYPVLGGKVFRGVRNATFNPVSKPGVLADYFRGNPHGDDPIALLRQHEPIRPEYRDRDARLATMDAHGLEQAWLFPTLGMIYEEPLRGDIDAVTALFTAFNRWIAEDWGFAHADRLFAAPYITLVDVDWACAELERALDGGARTVVMRPAAPTTRFGPRSPADRANDPFWARVAEAGITVVVHAGDSGYTAHGYAGDGFSTDFGQMSTPIRMLQLERPIEDFLAALVCENLFHRFPNLRIASVENGSGFLPGLFHRLDVTARKIAGWWPEDPVETFRRHVWINPFWEDQVDDVIDLMGADRVLFGSDWPHIEALPLPLDYVRDVAHLDEATQRLVLRDNARELNELRPA
jgi:predicted TIM-barrel fold metal-dependent hydrolase